MTKLINFFYEIGTLRKTARSHRQALLSDDLSDNIASHSYRVAMIGYFLAKEEKADAHKVAVMCLFHDVGEARTGDQNYIHKKYLKTYDDEVLHDQLKDLTADNREFKIAQEYHQRQTLEAKVAKDADLLDQALLMQEYIQAGNQEAQRWQGPHKEKEFHTATAIEMYREIVQTKPSQWWQQIWTSERR